MRLPLKPRKRASAKDAAIDHRTAPSSLVGTPNTEGGAAALCRYEELAMRENRLRAATPSARPEIIPSTEILTVPSDGKERPLPLFIVSYEHPDEAGWSRHVAAHIIWLQERLKDGSLVASGPVSHASAKAALLIMTAPDRGALQSLISTDPFSEEGLIANMTIREWDPIFGSFNNRSSMPGQMQGH